MIDAASHGLEFLIGHLMTAHAGIIPIAHIERAVGGNANVRRAKPFASRRIVGGEDVVDFGFVTGAILFDWIGADNASAGIGVDCLAVEALGKRFAFVNKNAAGSAGAGLEKVRHDAGIVLMPVAQRNFVLPIAALLRPAFAVHFVGVTVVAVVENVIDADALVAVVVVIGLPHAAEGIDADFVVVAKIVSEHLEIAAVEIAAENHALAIRIAFVIHFVAVAVDDGRTVRAFDLFSFVAEIEIEFAIGAEDERVNTVIVIDAREAGEEQFFFVGDAVAIFVGENEHIGRARNDHFVAENADAEGGVNFFALVEDGFFIGGPVAVGVFENDNAIAAGTE